LIKTELRRLAIVTDGACLDRIYEYDYVASWISVPFATYC